MDFGREITGSLAVAESREWLCTNGLGGFASGTVAGLPTRRYHGLLVAALKPPVGRTVLVGGLHERIEYDGATYELSTARWADGTVAPAGYRLIERFYLDGTTPVWHYACADTLVEKRVWMEPGANTTYVRYRLLRAGAGGPVRLTLRALVNYREFHVTTHGPGWQMAVAAAGRGLQITAYDGARPLSIQVPGATAEPAHDWYVGFRLAAEEVRGLDALDDSLHAGTFTATLAPDRPLTAVLSAEARPDLDGEQAWARRRAHETLVLLAWRKAQPAAGPAPAWIERLVLAADQFVVSRPLADDPGGLSVIAGYHWFGDWGRDTMIALPGLTLCHRTPRGGPAHPDDLRALRRRRHAAQRVPGRGRAARVQHGGRRALVRGGGARLSRGNRRRRGAPGALPGARADRRGPTRRGLATASGWTRPTGSSPRASPACSSRGWTRGSATGW